VDKSIEEPYFSIDTSKLLSLDRDTKYLASTSSELGSIVKTATWLYYAIRTTPNSLKVTSLRNLIIAVSE
jgi:hypothetical protein